MRERIRQRKEELERKKAEEEAKRMEEYTREEREAAAAADAMKARIEARKSELDKKKQEQEQAKMDAYLKEERCALGLFWFWDFFLVLADENVLFVCLGYSDKAAAEEAMKQRIEARRAELAKKREDEEKAKMDAYMKEQKVHQERLNKFICGCGFFFLYKNNSVWGVFVGKGRAREEDEGKNCST